jgi:hypothetical protein
LKLKNIGELQKSKKTSTLGVNRKCFGSSGQIIEDYLYMANPEFPDNKHIKSIVRGRQGNHFSTSNNSHNFNSIHGTHDELNRPIDKGLMPEYDISTQEFVINHYICQSYEFFINFKQKSGATDAGSEYTRTDEWWVKHDTNHIKDGKILKYAPEPKAEMKNL